MGVEDRFNRAGTVFSISEAENAAGGLIEAWSSMIEGYRYMVFSPTVRNRQLLIDQFGLNKDDDIRSLAGQYDSRILVDQVIDDDASGEFFKVKGVHPQRGMSDTPQHITLVIVPTQRVVAEAN